VAVRLVFVVCLVGCGRFGFDGGTVDDASGDGFVQTADTPVGQPCSTDVECGRCARCNGTCQVEPITDLFLGHRSLCYTGTGGARWCTGENARAELGLGDAVNRSLPERALDGDGWSAIYLSFYGKAVGVRNGRFWEWGGDATKHTPIDVGASRPIRDVLGDINYKGMWESDGTFAGDPSASTWQSLAYGADHFCGVKTNGTLWCWGTNKTNALGQPGMPLDQMEPDPLQVGAATNWVAVTTGGNLDRGSTCGRTTGGQILCWGAKDLTGTNRVDVTTTPTLVNADTDWVWHDTDWENTCARKADGRVYCWGDDTYGGFVAVGQASAYVPTQIPGTYSRWVMGGHHGCGLDMNGRWHCVGWNEQGQLGVGNMVNDGALVSLCP